VVMNMLVAEQNRQGGQKGFVWSWPGFCMVIFLIGLFPATNFWDFPIYIVVSGAMYLYANLRIYNYKLTSWVITLAQVVLTGVASYLVVYPFNLNFEPISTKIEFVKINTAFYQLCVLYGYQAVIFIMLVITAVLAYKGYDAAQPAPPKKERINKAQASKPLILLLSAPPELTETAGRTSFDDFIEKSNPADIIAIVLFICAFGLIAIPEIIYVKDIYPNDPRANTMFKLTYQAFIMLTLGIGYSFARMFLCGSYKGVYKKVTAVIAALLLCGAFEYPFIAIHQWFGSVSFANYKGLDGIKYMLTFREQLTKLTDETFPEGQEPTGDPSSWPQVESLKDDYQIIQYINENVKGQPVIAEANHLSYTTFGRVAANTGLLDIFNWYTHELLWRNSHESEFRERTDDLFYLYTTPDKSTADRIIAKYNISYIMVGQLERAKFRNIINENTLRSLGEIVSQSNDTYLIKVTR